MFSVILSFVLLIVLLVFMRFSKAMWIKYVGMFLFSLFVIEAVLLGFFLVRVYQANSFMIIGHDKLLDSLIKLRLTYSTYFAQGQTTFINRVDSDLGYTLGSDKDIGLYQTNGQGFRADREYTSFPDDKHLRVAALGDSFVFCDGERNEDAWPVVLENMSDQLEVLNFGVPGYGLGQSYLRYLKDVRQFHPDIVFINYANVGPRDSIDRQNIVVSNLRYANFYRVQFWVEDGILRSRAISPYDFFDAEFRRKHFFDEEQVLSANRMGWLKHAAFFNFAELVKERVLLSAITKKPQINYRDHQVEKMIISELIKVAHKDGSQVIFYGVELSDMSKTIQELVRPYGSSVMFVNGRRAFEEQVALHNASNHVLLNSSAHYNAEGNSYYAKALFKVLSSREWCRGDRCFELRAK